MKVLTLGDLFVTCDIMKKSLDQAFAGSGITLEYNCLTDNWPVEPLQRNDEVREYVGSEAEIVEQAHDAEIIFTHSAPVTRKIIDTARNLIAVGAARGGPVNVNLQACTNRGIPLFYAAGGKAGAVAEFTVGLILAQMRNITRSHMSLFNGNRWRGDLYVVDEAGFELSSAVVGLVGLGDIGKKVARLLACFGAQILVYEPYIAAEEIKKLGYRPVEFNELLQNSDIVTLHARLTPETEKMIGEKELDLMKNNAYLVNTARGKLVDHDALYRALKAGKISGAALDVFDQEPLPADSPLYELENVTVTSHLGGASVQAAENGAASTASDIARYVTGKGTPNYCANPEVLEKS